VANKAFKFTREAAGKIDLGAWSDIQFTDAISIDFWFKMNATPPSVYGVLTLGKNSATEDIVKVTIDASENFCFWVYNTITPAWRGTAVHNANVDAWYHVVCVFERNVSLSCYWNNHKHTGSTFDADINDAVGAVRDLGHLTPGWSAPISLDEVRFWNVALTDDNVATLYNAGAGTYGDAGISGLVAGYHADDDAIDYVGDKDGTLGGTTTYEDGKVIAPPVVSSIDPDSGKITNADCQVTITGEEFAEDLTVKIVKGATTINATEVELEGTTEIQCKLDLTDGSVAADWDVVVTNADTRVGTGVELFDIKSDPKIDSFTPASGAQGIIPIAIVGSGYLDPGMLAWLVKAPDQVMAAPLVVEDSENLTATFDMTTAALGEWSLAVIYTDGNGDTDGPFTLTGGSSGPTPGQTQNRCLVSRLRQMCLLRKRLHRN
jgi:hypothetical protein